MDEPDVNFFTCSESNLQLWNIERPSKPLVSIAHRDVHLVSPAPDGTIHVAKPNGVVQVFTRSGECIETVDTQNPILDVKPLSTFSHRLIACASASLSASRIMVVDIMDKLVTGSFDTENLSCISTFSKKYAGFDIVAGSRNGKVTLWYVFLDYFFLNDFSGIQ